MWVLSVFNYDLENGLRPQTNRFLFHFTRNGRPDGAAVDSEEITGLHCTQGNA